MAFHIAEGYIHAPFWTRLPVPVEARMTSINLVLLVCLAMILAPSLAAAADVERWGQWQRVFQGPSDGNCWKDVSLKARFTQQDRTLIVPGFYDGDGKYVIRFMPPAEGVWTWTTISNRRELDGHSGSITVGPPSRGNHGPVEVFRTFYLRYADGTPYHQFGTTCYAWIHQPQALQQQTLKTLAAAPFNKIRFCIFPKSYAYNRNEPELFAFRRKPDGRFDFDQFDPAFWAHLERRIADLRDLGIEADLILWHPYDRWGFSEMSDEQDDRYLRYCIARLASFRNVWWSLANEYDLMIRDANQPRDHRGNKQMADWDRFFRILQEEDPYNHMRGIHNCRGFYDHTRPWVTHASLQSSDMAGGVRYRRQYQKPIIYDECRYEGDIPQGWGNLSAREMVQRFWLGTLSGCYVGHGETYKHPEDILWWSKGGVLHGQSPQRIRWLKELMAGAPPFHELTPMGDDRGRYILGMPGRYYLVYCASMKPVSVELAGERPYKVDLIDPWEMTSEPWGTAPAGTYTAVPPRADVAFRFEPYAPGEALRPAVKVQAEPAEGTAPLTVRFQASPAGRMQWDLGDGSSSDREQFTHTYSKPGAYQVRVKVTDAAGATGVGGVHVLVDRDAGRPIVRVGFREGETPSWKLEGTARRGDDGSIVLPDGQPWGWASAGDKPLEELRALRSFTIAGWLKPDKLQIGPGGNRIVFCLNCDHSGIDLVCLADGRMRLSVNEWPDKVNNDSAPGRLVAGKWTFFAVTYDCGAQQPVVWYFSEPLAAPGTTEIKLDRRNAYNAGPVSIDIGPLAVGNFNQTMRSFGMDRQFRGEIRALQIYGSLLAGRGALSLEMIRSLAQ